MLIRLRQNETVATFALTSRPAGTYYQDLVADGNAIVSTLFVDEIDPGASVSVTFEDIGLSEKNFDVTFLGNHEVINTAPAISKTSVTRFHNKPRIKVVVTGGSAVFGLWATLKSEAVSDIQFGLGKTSIFVGTTVANLTTTLAGPGEKPIQQLSIRCAIDQSSSHRLGFSLDNGANYIKLAPGEAFSVAPRGEIREIKLIGYVHAVAYEVVLLTST